MDNPYLVWLGVVLLQDEYLKAYYAALFERQQQEAAKKQQELSSGQSSDQGPSSEREVGMKSKREDEDEDELEWEEAAPSGSRCLFYVVAFSLLCALLKM